MKRQHTPGPWRYVGHGGTHGFDPQGRCIFDAPQPNEMPREEGEANARLIAAAPELLEALEKLLDERYVCGDEETQEFDDNGNFTCNSPGCLRARAAITKATS